MRYHECPLCGEEIDTADYISHPHEGFGSQLIAKCLYNHHKVEVNPDAEFDDGMWRNLTTIRPLLALEAR